MYHGDLFRLIRLVGHDTFRLNSKTFFEGNVAALARRWQGIAVATTLIWTVHIKKRNTGEHRELQASRADKHRLKSQDPQPGLERGSRGHRKRQGPNGAHKNHSRPSGEDVLARLGPGGPPPSGRGARAPLEVKRQKPPKMLAVGGTLRDLCRGPRRVGGGGVPWTTCHSECEPPRPPTGRAGYGKEEGTQGTRPQGTGRQGQHPQSS